MSGDVAGPVVRIARTIGANSPSPKFAVSRSKAARDGTSGGRIDASGALNRTCRKGEPSISRNASVGTSTATGWRITRRARRDQAPSVRGRRDDPRTAKRSSREPTRTEDRGQQRQRGGDREPDDDRPGDPDRAQDHELEQDEPEQPEQDRQPAEEDRARRRSRPSPGPPRGPGRASPGPSASSSRKRLVISSE